MSVFIIIILLTWRINFSKWLRFLLIWWLIIWIYYVKWSFRSFIFMDSSFLFRDCIFIVFLINVFKINIFPFFIFFILWFLFSLFFLILRNSIRMSFIGLWKIIELFVFMFISEIHKAMALIHHMLLCSPRILEHLTAIQTQISQLNSLSNVSEQSLQWYYTVHIQNKEWVF